MELLTIGDRGTDDGNLGVRGGNRVHVLLPGRASSLGGEVSLLRVVRLVETHDSLGALGAGLVDVLEPCLRGALAGAVHHGNELGANVVVLDLAPVVTETELAAEGLAKSSLVVSETTLGAAVATAGAGGLGGSSRRGDGGRDNGRNDGADSGRLVLGRGSSLRSLG
jgi:hypothetical protein